MLPADAPVPEVSSRAPALVGQWVLYASLAVLALLTVSTRAVKRRRR